MEGKMLGEGTSNSRSNKSERKPSDLRVDLIYPFDLNYPPHYHASEDNAPILTSIDISLLTVYSGPKLKDIDLNCPPLEDDTSASTQNQPSSAVTDTQPTAVMTYSLPTAQNQPEKKSSLEKKRSKPAFSKHVASITLDDISKYFDRPSKQACVSLKIGQTVLKRKCREFGILRWPYRKIKSLDNLIHNIKEDAERREPMSEAVADEVLKKQKLIESEKELIEKRPAFQLKSETKKLRQHIFKRRHLARTQLESGKKRNKKKQRSLSSKRSKRNSK